MFTLLKKSHSLLLKKFKLLLKFHALREERCFGALYFVKTLKILVLRVFEKLDRKGRLWKPEVNVKQHNVRDSPCQCSSITFS